MKQKHKIRKRAFLTSGGDALGMNAVIRAVVRTTHVRGIPMQAVLRGYGG